MSKETENIGCIVGAVLQLKQDHPDIRNILQTYAGLDMHGEDQQARLVITLEAKNSRAMLQLSEEIQQLEGILQFMPVYQYNEDHHQKEQHRGWQWR